MRIYTESAGRGKFHAKREDGSRITRMPTETPLFTSCRILKAEGVPDDEIVEMVRENGVVSMRVTVGNGAELTVDKKARIVPYVPFISKE